MKTAMTQLVEFLNKLNTDSSEPPNLERRLLQKYCENLLKTEKDQIMEVVEFCDAHCDDGCFDKEGAIANIKSTFNL